MEKYFLKY